MQFNFTYSKSSVIEQIPGGTNMSFSPDLNRTPTYFRGKLKEALLFREAISAMHDVVVSDLRYKEKERTDFKEWLKQEEMKRLALRMAGKSDITEQMDRVNAEIQELYSRRSVRWRDYWQARDKLRKYLESINPAFRWVFDPVITVHPDEIFFECFSQDESTYARLGTELDLFEKIEEFEYGTTNIDFSAALFNEMQKIRTYKNTFFEIDPEGFQVETTGEPFYKEKKIDLPDSWMRGFLQVQTAMSLPMITFELSPVDIYNMCVFLRRNREKKSPRALRYELTPGKPVKMIFEPWEYALEAAESKWEGEKALTVRTWGRRRLHVLERLIPVAKKVKVHLLGRGLPSFYVIYLDGQVFTLGLSGWTSNDWAGASNFDLLSSRPEVDIFESTSVLNYLKEKRLAGVDEISLNTKLDRAKVLGSLNLWCQYGKVTYDLSLDNFRYRELTKTQIPLDDLAFTNEREKSAARLLEKKSILISSRGERDGGIALSGKTASGDKIIETSLFLDRDDKITEAECGCYWHKSNKLQQGPCEHIIALRSLNGREERKKLIK